MGRRADLARRIRAEAERMRPERRGSIDTWLADYLLPAQTFGYGGVTYSMGVPGLQQTMPALRVQQISQTLPGYFAAIQACPPAFAAQLVRGLVLSQARLTWRAKPYASAPRKLFGTADLALFEQPWQGGTTGDLIAMMEWSAGLAGNAFVTSWQPGRLRVLRPDWVWIVWGSQRDPEDPAVAIDAEVVGYVYAPRGILGGDPDEWIIITPPRMAHWAPIPDPINPGLGMSWITPAVREMQTDRVVTEHKLRYFTNGATPNLVIKGISAKTRQEFLDIVELIESGHAGVDNAYRTLYLTGGSDASVVGANLADLDLKAVQGASETRISTLSRVPPTILGIAEGLAGSALNAGNFGQTRRLFGDVWVYPTLQSLSSALTPLITVPSDADLWFDTTDIPLLREDAKDAAAIQQIHASTITALISAGFEPQTAIDAVIGQDMRRLKHTGLVSVQLQPPGSDQGAPP